VLVLKFVQYNACICINFPSWVIEMILKFYENVFLIVTTTTTTTTATDTSVVLQLSFVQCLLNIIF